MATLRDALYQRCDSWLQRVARLDSQGRDESLDIRSAMSRGFLEGGDDIPPECEARGVARQRRRIPWLEEPDRDAAADRLKNPEKLARSTDADWDRFVAWGGGGSGLYRTTMQLMVATRAFDGGEERKVTEVLDLGVASLPPLSDTDRSVPKAWHLLLKCGAPDDRLEHCFSGKLAAIDGDMAVEGVGKVSEWMGKALRAWLRGFGGVDPIPNPFNDPPAPAPVYDASCPCQKEPPKSSGPPPAPPPPPPTLIEARITAADALLAAYGNESAQPIVDEFRLFDIDETSIARVLLWLAGRWTVVIDDAKFISAHPNWQARNGKFRLDVKRELTGKEKIAINDAKIHWEHDVKIFNSLRAVPQFFAGLSQKNVGEACREICKQMWSDEDDAPFGKKLLESSDIEQDDYLDAIDRAMLREDAPFRLATLVTEPEGYIRVLDNAGVEDGTGANRLQRPSYDGLGAYWWRTTILPSTIGHLLTQIDTADFHIAEHLRFLGLFRPSGGKFRPGNNQKPEREQWLQQFVPGWVTDFMIGALLRVKYWVEDRPLERPNKEEMTYWSENHQILFASSEYILPTWFSGERFAYLDHEASWHRDRAKPRVLAWLDHRLAFGFAEQNSGVYYNQHLPALFNLVDFAPDDVVKTKATMVLDLMVFDIVRRVSRGAFVTASGRQYWGSKRDGWSVSILSFIELLTGLVGDHLSASENSAASFVTSDYLDQIPEALLAVAHDLAAPRVDRSRVSIDMKESKDYGIDPESAAGLIFWWGCGGYYTKATMSTTVSWANRWSLRHTGPFKFLFWIDTTILRLASSVIGALMAIGEAALLTTGAGLMGQVIAKLIPSAQNTPLLTPAGGFPVTLMNGAIMSPRILRRLVDVYLGVADAVIAVMDWAGKLVGLLDEDDDRVRVARPALEQELRELAIQINAGSVLQRQNYYGWRSRDAMLSSLTDCAKGLTAFQSEPCLATLGLNVTVFTGSRPFEDDEDSTLLTAAGNYFKGLARNFWDSDTWAANFEIGGGESAPELGRAIAPLAASEIFGDDGPKYWFGNLSMPMVAQRENVAITIYAPDELQRSLGPEETHAHWPFNHFDEFRTEEKSGGRWLFGRRDRRFPPRTPCMPVTERTPGSDAWPVGKWRDEGGDGSGYIALFSARGFKTAPKSTYANREVVADGGHDNVFITVVGDRATYGSFDAFVADVLAATLDTNIDDRHAAITLPDPGSAASGQRGKHFEVSWDDGIKLAGDTVQTGDWPRFEWVRSAVKVAEPLDVPDNALRVDDVRVHGVAEPSKNRVDWGEKNWRLDVDVRAWFQLPEDEENGRPAQWQPMPGLLFLEHDLRDADQPKRRTSDEGQHTLRDPPPPRLRFTVAAATATRESLHSLLTAGFRRTRTQNLSLRRITP